MCVSHTTTVRVSMFIIVFCSDVCVFRLIYIVTNRINDCKVFTTKLIQKIRIVDATGVADWKILRMVYARYTIR